MSNDTTSRLSTNCAIIRELHFCAGHRVMGHESKCAHLHGHNYELWLHAELSLGDGLDDIGRVVDFSVVKKAVEPWLDEMWDHGFVLHKDDEAAQAALATFNYSGGPHGGYLQGGISQKIYLMPYNPTAENMGRYLLEEICPRLFKEAGVVGVKVTKVTIFETPRCAAEVTLV